MLLFFKLLIRYTIHRQSTDSGHHDFQRRAIFKFSKVNATTTDFVNYVIIQLRREFLGVRHDEIETEDERWIFGMVVPLKNMQYFVTLRKRADILVSVLF